jgi:hypothetical protein
MGRDGGAYEVICVKRERKCFCRRDWTGTLLDLPVGTAARSAGSPVRFRSAAANCGGRDTAAAENTDKLNLNFAYPRIGICALLFTS